MARMSQYSRKTSPQLGRGRINQTKVYCRHIILKEEGISMLKNRRIFLFLIIKLDFLTNQLLRKETEVILHYFS